MEREPSAVLIEPAVVELDPGDQQTLRLVVLDGSGRRLSRIPTGMSVFWESEDPRVVGIDETGTVTARLPGRTAVVARVVYRNQSGGFIGSASLAGGPPSHARAETKVRGGATTIEAVGTTERVGVAGELVVDSPAVRVVNHKGRPVSGVPMRFETSDGQLTSTVVETDGDGIARTGWRLGPERGAQELNAYVPELSPDTISFVAAASGAPAWIVLLAGGSQTGVVGQALGTPLAVRVTDDGGSPVTGASVSWNTTQGSVSPTWSLTDGNGVATTTWTLGTTAGTQGVIASVGALSPVAIGATATAGAFSKLVKVSGDAQTADGGSTLPQPLVVRTADAYGNGVAGVAVEWSTVSTGAGTLTAESATSNAQGLSRAAWTLGTVSGQHYARAAADGAQEAMYVATVTDNGTVSRIEIQPAGPITFSSVGDTARLNVQGYTAGGTPVGAGSITWSSGNTGVVEVNLLGTLLAKGAGTALVVARLAAGTAADTVSVTVTPTVASITVTPSPATVQAGGTVQLVAQPRDGAGNPVQATVTWSTSASSIATVNGSGLVTGVGAGSATITAHVGTVSRAVALTVTSPTTGGGGGGGETASAAELPRVYLSTGYSAPGGQTIRVPAGGDLQAAIDNASRGDRILLAPGATYGKITLPQKSGSGWIYIETETSLPAEGTRVSPSSVNYAKIQTSNEEPAVRAPSGASHYRFVGVEVTASTSRSWTYMLIELQPGSSHITIDRSYVHGHASLSFQRCVSANAAHFALIDSYVAECHGEGIDSQAIGAWDSPGPFKIVNNYLEGAAENVLFGGADPRVTGATPSDIEFRRNHVRKPLEWEGSRWQVKYLFELKNAQRVLVEDNVFENSFDGADAGWAFVLKSTNQEGTCGTCKTQDVTVRYNRIINARHGFNLLSREYYEGAAPPAAGRMTIRQNVFESSEPGISFQLLGALHSITIENNTVDPRHQIVMFDGAPMSGLVMRNNLFGHSTYGVFGGGVGSGTAALEHYAPGYVFNGNGLVGYSSSEYPSGNLILSSMSVATSGTGADVTTINSRTSGVRR